MSKYAMLFPGQGSQYVGMGKDYYDAYDEAKQVYKDGNRTLGFDLAALSFEGDLDELTKTHNAQPAILLHSLAVLSVVAARGWRPAVVAGHSLGEFSALVAAGVFKPMDALMIVRRRGELMYEAGLEQPGTMAAIMGMDEAGVQAAVDEAARGGIVVIANYNSPDQYAISGEVDAVDRAVEAAKAGGARRAMRLQVSGAFHSPLMERTSDALTSYIGKFERRKLRVAWIANVTGDKVKDDGAVVDLLSRQLSSPVQWVRSMRTLTASHEAPVVEAGPGRVLSGLMKRIEPEVPVDSLGTVDGLEAVASA